MILKLRSLIRVQLLRIHSIYRTYHLHVRTGLPFILITLHVIAQTQFIGIFNIISSTYFLLPASYGIKYITGMSGGGVQSLATNSPAPGPRPLTCGVSSECLGTRSYETTSRDQRGKIQMFFSLTGACTAAKFPIENHHSQINTQLYSASLIRLIWQQRHSDSEFDAL